MVSNLQDKNPEVRNFLQFVSSDEGKQIMRKAGTVPYEDAVGLWLTYLDQQNRAMANRLHVAEPTVTKTKAKTAKN
jgi:hypothetical protein